MSKISEKADANTTGVRAITPFEQRCVDEYLKDLSPARAFLRAGGGGNRDYAPARARELFARPVVKAALDVALKERKERTLIDADTVLREVAAIATADTNEIVEIRRGCCRHCHGVEHRYQYVDQQELDRAREAFEQTNEALVEAFKHGGLGFDARQAPDSECIKCSGEGGAYVHVKDTRDLSPAARALFAGAKQTKDGIEVKLHSKDKHVELLMRHLGLLNDKLEVSGDLGERIIAARKRQRGGA